MTVEKLFQYAVEWSGEVPGFVTVELSQIDVEEFLNDNPDNLDVSFAISFDALTDSLIKFCGFDGVVVAADDVVFIESQAAALEHAAHRLRAACKARL